MLLRTHAELGGVSLAMAAVAIDWTVAGNAKMIHAVAACAMIEAAEERIDTVRFGHEHHNYFLDGVGVTLL